MNNLSTSSGGIAAKDRLEQALKSQDFAQVRNIFLQDFIEIWFTVHPEQLRDISGHLKDHDINTEGYAEKLFTFLDSMGSSLQDQESFQENDEPFFVALFNVGKMFHYRLSGQLSKARELADRIEEETQVPIFPMYSPNAEAQLLFYVQNGITGMLQGDYEWALQQFTNALINFDIPSLSLLKRDAYAKVALMHVLFGRNSRAKYYHQRAQELPIMDSWAEPGISTTLKIVEALLLQSTPEEAIEVLEDVELSTLGEMWSYYVFAFWKLSVISGGTLPIPTRVTAIMQSPLVIPGAEGMIGSAVPLLEAISWIKKDDLEEAKRALSIADQDFVVTKLLHAQIALLQEDYEAYEQVTQSTSENFGSMKQLDMWARCMEITALYRRNYKDQALKQLHSLQRFLDQFYEDEILFLPKDILVYAQKNLPDWGNYLVPEQSVGFEYRKPLVENVTTRELEILTLLTEEDLTQQDIANHLYISVNTLKTHLRAIYRKLGVKSRAKAVEEAIARDMLPT